MTLPARLPVDQNAPGAVDNQLLIESGQIPVEKQQESSPFISKVQFIFKKPFHICLFY